MNRRSFFGAGLLGWLFGSSTASAAVPKTGNKKPFLNFYINVGQLPPFKAEQA